MRVLILGVSGLLGHRFLQDFSNSFEVFGTLRKSKDYYGNIQLFSGQNVIENINVCEFDLLKGVIAALNPDVILNCVGITKRKVEINDAVETLTINSVFPHKLAYWSETNNKRVIHFSTDCVFDGKIGNYTETSLSTAEDFYGKSKALGEINYKNSLTIRSSFIGQELSGKTELLEWFLAQNGKQIQGFTNTYYSGVSTIFMASTIKNIILNFPKLSGLYNLAPEKPISKYELLSLAATAFNTNVDIIPDESNLHNPTLDGSRLRNEINLSIPSWKEMLTELALQKDFYTNLK
jgi:dTDP-4-dehydrorhamnose reductase